VRHFEIVRVTAENYPLFDAMVRWRMSGVEQEPTLTTIPDEVLRELGTPGFTVYAACTDGRYVGWIALCYLPKIGKWKRGHLYVDELWVAEAYRRQGIGRALMERAEELAREMAVTGLRLYVNVENPGAGRLYESCGYRKNGTAEFMEKELL